MLEELRLRWNEKKKECDELESRIRQIEQSVEELKNAKLQSWIKTEFDLHYFDEINFNDYSRVILFKRGNINGVFTASKSILVHDPAITAEYMEYKFINKNIIRVKENLSEKKIIKYKEYMRNNPRLFKKLKHISVHKIAIIYKYEKYHNLLFRHNYLQCLTFLLCNSFQKTFCRDIEKLIAQKIFFGWPFGPFLFIKNKKGPKGHKN